MISDLLRPSVGIDSLSCALLALVPVLIATVGAYALAARASGGGTKAAA